MIVPRRFLVVAALMFWQGGFTFYAAVVVPVGQEVLGSHLEQGFITRAVTNYLNLAGLLALVVLAWDVAATRDPSVPRRRWRWLTWAGMVIALGLLAWLHTRLDELLDLSSERIVDRGRFRTEHRWYLWVSTVQWGFGIVYALGTLSAWRAEDVHVKKGERWQASEATLSEAGEKNVPPLTSSASPSHRSHHAAGQRDDTLP